MNANPNVAEIAAILGEPSRALILTSLMDGRFHTASELAYMAGIKQQTASFHLAKLTDAHLITKEKHGRHRYYQLVDGDVAQVVESFLSIARPPEIRSLKQSAQMKSLKSGRTCYDHLAGELGVKLTQHMLQEGIIEKTEKEFMVTAKGELFFEEFGLDIATLRQKRRSFSRTCLDWSERQHHLAGALGQAITAKFFDLNWIERHSSSRAVKLTKEGETGLKNVFHLSL
ncbi:transcriptional regulator [Virgibacillus phasianinus]|uniref:Transcriptional regulator n=1 Tax=Virgibacillus phasianinus TaxID=2017483 RepID=A0A220TYI5_9BACI|nr:metalloregulator ArsR/SmtB family transcription factor [Virgibacillus phasianinus]ASK60776.1 transcriptional regulator [Virgibacillus phasianinus]